MWLAVIAVTLIDKIQGSAAARHQHVSLWEINLVAF